MIRSNEIFLIIFVVACFAFVGLATYKVIKSKLTDIEKVFWVIAFLVLNIFAAIPFIIFHDYFLSKEKKAS